MMLQFRFDQLPNRQKVLLREYRSAWGWGWEIVRNYGWT